MSGIEKETACAVAAVEGRTGIAGGSRMYGRNGHVRQKLEGLGGSKEYIYLAGPMDAATELKPQI